MAGTAPAAMRGLIVNADDFGLSPGINRAVAKAHRDGIVTSTSLLVNTPFSAQAATMSAAMPRLRLGLHADVSAAVAEPERDRAVAICRDELECQMARFRSLTGRSPTHLDSHHNAHRHPKLTGAFVQFGERHRLRVREHCNVTYVSAFYGRWNGGSRPEQVSLSGLERVLRDAHDSIVELACHPGYCDGALQSSYGHEREIELGTLCDERVPQLLDELGFALLDSALRRHVHGRD
jgi:chitin disaccharide deacetylase